MSRLSNLKTRAQARNGVEDDQATGSERLLGRLSTQPLSRSDGPLYRQLNTLLRAAIRDSGLDAGHALPREADIASRFGVSLITVRQAMRELQLDGLIQKRAAKPAVIARPTVPKSAIDFESLASIAASANDRRLDIASYGREASALASEVFGLSPKERPYCLRAVLYAGEQPGCRCTFFFPPAIGRRLKRKDFDDVVVFRSVQRRLGIKLSGARINVRAELAGEELAEALLCEPGFPILVTEMLYRSAEGDLVEFTINENRADFFSLSFEAPNGLI